MRVALPLARILRVIFLAFAILSLTAAGARADDAPPTTEILRLEDFPPGWQATPFTAADSKLPKNASCGALAKEGHKSVSSARTPKFSDPRGSHNDVVNVSLTTYRSARDAQDDVTAFVGRHRLRCLIDSTNHDFESANPGATATTKVTELHLPGAGARARAVEAITHVSGFATFELRQQIVFLQNGTRVAVLHVNTDQAADYTSLRDHLIQLMVERLAGGRAVSV